MKEEPYSTRELDAHFQDIKDLIAGVKNDVKEVKTQVLLTNGRVKTLELWRAFLAGSVGVIVAIGLPILGYLALRVVEGVPTITAAVIEAKK